MIVNTLLSACALPGVSSGAGAESKDVPASPLAPCAVTARPQVVFVPPAPYPPAAPSAEDGAFWYGSAQLWTMLSDSGSWASLPRSATGYSQKTFWWWKDYNPEQDPNPDLSVTGKQLDAPDSHLIASRATNASAEFGQAVLVGVEIPSPGCWEITGEYRGHKLSFVVRVLP